MHLMSKLVDWVNSWFSLHGHKHYSFIMCVCVCVCKLLSNILLLAKYNLYYRSRLSCNMRVRPLYCGTIIYYICITVSRRICMTNDYVLFECAICVRKWSSVVHVYCSRGRFYQSLHKLNGHNITNKHYPLQTNVKLAYIGLIWSTPDR